jgi:hypothetical protein
VTDLPPIGATIVVVDQVDARDIIVATSGGSTIATTNILASTQRYFHQPSRCLNIELMKLDIIPGLSYLLLWLTQKMKFLIPNLYTTPIMDDMPTYRETIQSVYDNPMGRVYFSRHYVMPALKENVKPDSKQWGTFKSLVWKLAQNILIPRGYYPYTRWNVRKYLNKCYGYEFAEYCAKFSDIERVDLGDGAIWYMCEGDTRPISSMANREASMHLPIKLVGKFNPYVIPFMLDMLNRIVDENLEAILIHSSLKAVPSMLNAVVTQHPPLQDLVNNARPYLDVQLEALD